MIYKLLNLIAPVGQPETQVWHSVHLRKSIYARLSCTVIASAGQFLAHLPQPIQAAEQFFLATGPFSLFMQVTYTRPSVPLNLNSIIWRGQFLTQAPHPTHAFTSTTGSFVTGSMWRALNWHEPTQSPQPRQPYGHALSPA